MEKKKKVMLISSGGGHWIQLQCLKDAWEDLAVIYVSVNIEYKTEVYPSPFYLISDGNKDTKLQILKMAFQVAGIMIKQRPDFIISTGAAPGFWGVVIGKLIGAKTIWIDSIANAEQLSLSGRLVKNFADLWLTQWSHLEEVNGPLYKGSVI